MFSFGPDPEEEAWLDVEAPPCVVVPSARAKAPTTTTTVLVLIVLALSVRGRVGWVGGRGKPRKAKANAASFPKGLHDDLQHSPTTTRNPPTHTPRTPPHSAWAAMGNFSGKDDSGEMRDGGSLGTYYSVLFPAKAKQPSSNPRSLAHPTSLPNSQQQTEATRPSRRRQSTTTGERVVRQAGEAGRTDGAAWGEEGWEAPWGEAAAAAAEEASWSRQEEAGG